MVLQIYILYFRIGLKITNIIFKMRKHKQYETSPDSVMHIKINEASFQSTFDVSGPRVRFSKEKEKRLSIKLSKDRPSQRFSRLQLNKHRKEENDIPSMDTQLQLIMKMSNQIAHSKQLNSFQGDTKEQTKNFQNASLYYKLHKLFDLYIKEQILKHYCLKSGWKFQKKILDKLVIPTFDLLAISKDKLSTMFQPFLKQLTSKYILQTQLDTYSRLSSQALLIEITQIWLRIKQGQIEVKRKIRACLSQFKLKYCKLFQDRFVIDRNRLFHFLFQNSKDMRMVNLIKIFIFCFKSTGENNQNSFQEWLQIY